ncbi:hypothetical protein NKG05_25475 [Oerskovia sp. M15]
MGRVFEKIKGWLQGDQGEGGGLPLEVGEARQGKPSGPLVDGLRILDADADGLAARAVAYVHTGAGPEIVTELAQRGDDSLDRLLNRPATLGVWSYVSTAQAQAIKERIPGGTPTRARRPATTSTRSPTPSRSTSSSVSDGSSQRSRPTSRAPRTGFPPGSRPC